ncbi:MAG: serine/threonine-protein kinase, partial [Myxococcota bacterium]
MTDIILKEGLPEEPSTLGRVGRYVLLRRLAAGGMGEVFLAKLAGPVGFQKLVVLKRMLAQVEADSDYNRMFLAEAQITAQLNHSNIAQTYELGETDDGGYYIVMEYIRGKSLLDLLKRAYHAKEPIPYRLAVGIIAESCAGLGYAHGARGHDGAELNIVHRDVSPSNLLVSYAGEVKVIDFGIAIADSVERGTIGGQIKGKLSYMSPEQCRGDALDQRSDVFSLGVCLYEALTLRNPFKRDTLPSTMRAILEDPIPPALDDSHPLAPVLGPVLKRVLEKDREARISSCAELRET